MNNRNSDSLTKGHSVSLHNTIRFQLRALGSVATGERDAHMANSSLASRKAHLLSERLTGTLRRQRCAAPRVQAVTARAASSMLTRPLINLFLARRRTSRSTHHSRCRVARLAPPPLGCHRATTRVSSLWQWALQLGASRHAFLPRRRHVLPAVAAFCSMIHSARRTLASASTDRPRLFSICREPTLSETLMPARPSTAPSSKLTSLTWSS